MEKRILYVENEDSIYKMLSRLLKNYDLKRAPNLEDALDVIQKEDFNLYISDGNYPLKKGESAVYAWKSFYDKLIKIRPNANFVLYTGNPDTKKAAEALNIKAFNKTDISEFVDYVKEILKH